MTVTVDFNFKTKTSRATPKKLNRVSDGDTPVIEQPIRMVSIDTPEKAGYAGNPLISQPKLDICKSRLENGFYDDIPSKLRGYFIQKLTDNAAEKHVSAGYDATIQFEKALDSRLIRNNGSRRNLATIPAGEFIDPFGRLLAYIAPWFSGSNSDPLPPKNDPQRRTFNLEMVENGWAAIFPIYPSLPKNEDFNIIIKAAEDAWSKQKGIWEVYGKDVLLAYEFRACVKLGTAGSAGEGIDKAFQRYCVDLRDKTVKGKFGFYDIPPPYRMWIWEKDLSEAIQNLDLQNMDD